MKVLSVLVLSLLCIYAPVMSMMEEFMLRRNVDITLKIDQVVSTAKNDIAQCSVTYGHTIFHAGCGCHCDPRGVCCMMACERYPSKTNSTTAISQLPCTLHLDSSLSSLSVSYQNKTFSLTPAQVATIVKSRSGIILHLDTAKGKFTIKSIQAKPVATPSAKSPSQSLQSQIQNISSQIQTAIVSLQEAEQSAAKVARMAPAAA